jgi:hypothetical protein
LLAPLTDSRDFSISFLPASVSDCFDPVSPTEAMEADREFVDASELTEAVGVDALEMLEDLGMVLVVSLPFGVPKVEEAAVF